MAQTFEEHSQALAVAVDQAIGMGRHHWSDLCHESWVNNTREQTDGHLLG